jgi:uncharacterized membrane protein
VLQFALVIATVAAVIAFAAGSITYVYRDAPRRGMDADQWAGVLALTFGLGIVLYLLKRPPLEEVDVEEARADAGP